MKEVKTPDIWIRIGHSIPSPEDAWSFVQDASCGATHLFTGTTRDHHDGKKVTHLFYDCYEEMAILEMEKLANQVLESFPVHRVVLFHKVGDAPVGTVTLITAVSAPHRTALPDVTSQLVDGIKSSVPVWKRETFEKEGMHWKEERLVRKAQKPDSKGLADMPGPDA